MINLNVNKFKRLNSMWNFDTYPMNIIRNDHHDQTIDPTKDLDMN